MAADGRDDLDHFRRQRICLAGEPSRRLGPLTIEPALRRVAHDDGREEFVEPRVMQVLVALLRADGATLSRDALVFACWDGRIVGDDAINRVLSRLRRIAEGIGENSFRIETLTRVGYRLICDGQEVPTGRRRRRL
jgi:DNA-binding winged helix-turn-helix (wHTH) protein